ncbi:hypothetical protein LJY25_09500 [Hymenobacter sp. BT175]|uniref:hypothetical protein n=1 Tax=Hymenobacter translucens TaxID=2886507 RepID=UPI001D0DFB4D|nr:hypothetical protein [Hymenobacter translucens]MCC2546675.1 hypothetical protein [Hymenobacter translucens]
MTYPIKTSSGPVAVGIAVALIGLLLLLSPYRGLAVACLTVAAACVSSYHGIELDVGRQRYRSFTRVLGVHFGSWLHLCPCVRVVLKAHSDMMVHPNGSRSLPAERNEHLTLLLATPGTSIGQVMAEFTLYHREKALSVGKQLAAALQVPFVVMSDV